MNEYKNELDYYNSLNKVAEKNGVVFFGSTFAKNIPVSELGQTFRLDCNIYNRSFTDLSVFDAEKIIDDAVMSVFPKKIMLQLGETDIERGYKSVAEIISAYEKLINKIRKSDSRTKIVIVSVCSDESDSDKLNAELEKLSKKLKCQYVDITKADKSEMPSIKAFSMLKFFIPDRISFYDAIHFSAT